MLKTGQLLTLSALLLELSFVISFYNTNRVVFKHALKSASQLTSLEEFNEAQWNLMKKYQVGDFIGIQTGYDPEDEAVADYMYTQSNLVLENDIIQHTNSIVAQEIRSDCETCFDSERVKSKLVGQYSKGKLRSRLCENVEIRGPGLTPRGLSTEIIIRHEDGRIRVLLAYEPFYYDMSDNTPPAFKFSDYVVVRERISKRPLRLDINPDSMWITSDNSDFQGTFSGTRYSFIDSKCETETIHKIELPTFEMIIEEDDEDDKSKNFSHSDHTQASSKSMTNNNSNNKNNKSEEDDIVLNFKRVLEGRIMIQTPIIIESNFESIIRVSWMPENAIPPITTPTTLYGAQLEVLLPSSAAGPSGEIGMMPPKVTRFFVDKLIKDKN